MAEDGARGADKGGVAGEIWTIGHSTRSIDEFIDLLRENGIELVADVRRYPGSRKFPHFNPEPLAHALRAAEIGYEHLPALGGRRTPRTDSPYSVWRNEAFRGYADYMDTGEFQEALARLMRWARERKVTTLCSEAVWWRCHRSMIADALKSRGWNVHHIMSPGNTTEHPYTAPARASGGLPYPRADHDLPD